MDKLKPKAATNSTVRPLSGQQVPGFTGVEIATDPKHERTGKFSDAFKDMTPAALRQTLIWMALPNGLDDTGKKLRVSVVIAPRLQYSALPARAIELGEQIKQDPSPLVNSFPDLVDWPAVVRSYLGLGAGFRLEYSTDGNTGNVTQANSFAMTPAPQSYGTTRSAATPAGPESVAWKAIVRPDELHVKSYVPVDPKNDSALLAIRPQYPKQMFKTVDDFYRKQAGTPDFGNWTQTNLDALRSDLGTLKTNLINSIGSPVENFPSLFPKQSPLFNQVISGRARDGVRLSRQHHERLRRESRPVQTVHDGKYRAGTGRSSWLDWFISPAAAVTTPPPPPVTDNKPSISKAMADKGRLLRSSVTQPPLEFHSLIARLGAHPRLLRALGLVLDFEIPLDQVLATSAASSANLLVRVKLPSGSGTVGDPTARLHKYNITPWTATTLNMSLRDEPFHARPMNGANLTARNNPFLGNQRENPSAALWRIKGRMLALDGGDNLQFQPINVDEMGAVVQGVEMSHRVANTSDYGTQLPSWRSVGLAVRDDNRIHRQYAIAHRSKVLGDMFSPKFTNHSTPSPSVAGPDAVLYAEDLMHGIRVDVYDERANRKRWYSLCRYEMNYRHMNNGKTLRTWTDAGPGSEGDVVATMVENLSTQAGTARSLTMNERLFLWDGWSLVARSCNDEPGGGQCASDQIGTIPVAMSSKIVPKTLPSLRFGVSYKFRARIADLAGNSAAPPDKPLRSKTVQLVPSTEHATPSVMFRRSEPVLPPVCIPRRPPDPNRRPAESPLRMVLRTNYDGEVFDGVSESFVAPPAGTVRLAELHGRLDDANGVYAGDDVKTSVENMIKRANAASGIPQDAHVGARFTSENYLPDPLSRGVAFRRLPGLGKGSERAVTAPFPEVTTGGSAAEQWANLEAVVFRLEEGNGRPTVANATITCQLPKAEQVTIQISSLLDARHLPLMEFGHDMAGKSDAAVATSGGKVILTPPRDVTLVHAVRQPLAIAKLHPVFDAGNLKKETMRRDLGATWYYLDAIVALHGKSTGSVEITAHWDEYIDAPNNDDGFRVEKRSRSVLQAPVDLSGQVEKGISDGEAMFVFGSQGATTEARDGLLLGQMGFSSETASAMGIARTANQLAGPAPAKTPRHDLEDTRHLVVEYDVVATTRFREYFWPMRNGAINPPDGSQAGSNQESGLTERQRFTRPDTRPNPNAQGPIEQSVRSVRVHIPNSVRPPVPEVAYIIPTFGWGGNPNGVPSTHVRKGNGLRVYLRGPWYASGQDEMLAVIYRSSPPISVADADIDYVTQFGTDPLWKRGSQVFSTPPTYPNAVNFQTGSAEQAKKLSLAELTSWKEKQMGVDENQRPVFSPAHAVYHGFVDISAYPVKFDKSSGLWFSDVVVDNVNAYYSPFLKLALARYQPYSVNHAHLSRVVKADFMQLLPNRTASVQLAPDGKTVAVAVSGVAPTGSHFVNANVLLSWDSKSTNVVMVTVEKRNPDVADEALGWQPIESTTTVLTRANVMPEATTWNGQVVLPEVAHNPNVAAKYRIVYREYEQYVNGRRLVYLDALPLAR